MTVMLSNSHYCKYCHDDNSYDLLVRERLLKITPLLPTYDFINAPVKSIRYTHAS